MGDRRDHRLRRRHRAARDVIVADDDGAVVIPPALVIEVLEAAEDQELQEAVITDKVPAGESVDGFYPLTQTWLPQYEAWKADRTARDN